MWADQVTTRELRLPDDRKLYPNGIPYNFEVGVYKAIKLGTFEFLSRQNKIMIYSHSSLNMFNWSILGAQLDVWKTTRDLASLLL